MNEPIQWTNETRRLSELIPWTVNPRQLTERQAKHLETSLRKFGFAQPFLISPDNDIYDGHQRRALMDIMTEYGHDAPIDVRVSSRMLTDDERRELVIRLHENTGEWNYDDLANLYDVEELQEWGFPEWVSVFSDNGHDELDDDAELPLPDGRPNTIWPSDNEWGIPTLDITRQANAFDLPIEKWGVKARGSAVAGTIHFYTDDYKFNNLWQNPDQLLIAAPVNIVEPNYSARDQEPRIVALWNTYKKRWLARYWQANGVRVFVDLNVVKPHNDINMLGVPAGWGAYATHGSSEHIEELDNELLVARTHADGNPVLLFVYGSKSIGEWCNDNAQYGAMWIPIDSHRAEGRYEVSYGQG